jgi:HD-like signal output (HDOD) protein
MEQILPLVDKIPAFPQSVARVLSLASDINCQARDLVEVVSHDPVLTMKILRLVNSSYFGRAYKVTSIHQALVNIGLNTLKNTALSLALLGALPRKSETGFDIDALWVHSLAVGLAARRLALAAGHKRAQAEDFFVAGLLHDMGKLVFAQYLPAPFAQALEAAATGELPLYSAEERFLGVTHAQAGALLAQRWMLSETLVLGIARHHTPDDGEPSPLADVLCAANEAVKALGLGASGDSSQQTLTEETRQRLGLDAAQCLAALEGLAEEMEQSRMLLTL